ncbi:MAG: LUD domain-containing protein [Candidatus Amulumruptor caecigallinarius]|nr:LUD domain-containing protein [Candidatus Amulumruptor caecigallinarius]MCM1396232.1 LUD domain-containing protein [Candidatus Amulumruptor caecigallinarius]MCM1453768.1 LUD domain-containing protein [bacterium]
MTENNISSRDAILSRVRSHRHPKVSLPEVPHIEVTGDVLENFKKSLTGFDGTVVEVASRAEALDWLHTHVSGGTGPVYSSCAGFEGTVSADMLEDPHNAADLQSCVTESYLGVGETGSLWLTDESLGVVAAALLCIDLYVLIDRRRIVADIHEAYRAIDLRGSRYGSFFSGPSATADIEAIHITGAQAEMSLTAIIY